MADAARRVSAGDAARAAARRAARSSTRRSRFSPSTVWPACSAAQIARQAGAFPSQVTYYFGTKEALFVESACRGLLHAANEIEAGAARTRTPRTYVRALVRTALASPALLGFVEAAVLVPAPPRARPARARDVRPPPRRGRACRRRTPRRPRLADPLEPGRRGARLLGGDLRRRPRARRRRSSFDDASAEAAVALVLNLQTGQDADRSERRARRHR